LLSIKAVTKKDDGEDENKFVLKSSANRHLDFRNEGHQEDFVGSDEEDIDPEIIANLMTLGWDTEQSLIDSILSPEDNVEKVFYQFLYERKCDFLENGADFEVFDDTTGGPRRRADSFSAEFRERRSSNASASIKLRSQSPDSASLKDKKPNGLTVDTAAAMTKLAISPKPRKNSTDAPDSPGTPVGNTPKRSWFANLFTFKGAVLMLKTSSTEEEAMEEVKRCLNIHNIKFQPGSKEAALKCKHETTVPTALKGCKFRIEVTDQDNEVNIIFMHQQGSGTSYKAIFELIKNDLNLKDKRVVVPVVPAESK